MSDVCIVTGEFPPRMGGVGDYTALLAEQLQAAGKHVAVVTTQSPSGMESETAAALSGAKGLADHGAVRGGRLRGDPSEQEKVGELVQRAVPGWRLRDVRTVVEAVRSCEPRLVHLQYQTAAYGMSPLINVMPLALRAVGVRAPFITTFHDLRVPYLFPRAGAARRAANRALLAASTACIFTDPADLVRARPRVMAGWIPIGPNIEPGERQMDRIAVRRSLGLARNDFVLVFFGFLNASKGIDTLLGALSRLKRSDLHAPIVLVGDERGSSDATNSGTASRVREAISRLGLNELVRRTGPLPPAGVSDVLSAGDLAVLPFADGASLRRGSLLACLAHGLPVLTTGPVTAPVLAPAWTVPPFDSPSDLQLDDRTVALAPPADEAALAREIYRLANDRPRLQQLGAAGRAFASLLSWPDIARAHLTMYKRVGHG